ncbi:hypothetical protein OCH239_09290 [Roseivivax halodurans JCM 10272]|uniref:Uncharacterized protein n=1 Tax=Roseivivax halodurans JCM 10272 TaxID=1449350 RepID=X7EES0_9RHOB|nr:hypothetical protein [Roseivivax halodurans]ETX13628.1 hypothetical protein OCH239_09290 [Roseivivax halodurans JCM 10272]
MTDAAAQHLEADIDDRTVSEFADAMRAKLARSRAKGRGGWHDPRLCTVEELAAMMAGHLAKSNPGNLIDIAVFAMMLHHRGAPPTALVAAMQAAGIRASAHAGDAPA